MSQRSADQPNARLRQSVAGGATWMVAMRWTVRSIGLLNTAILARVLMPQDFGLVAMAAVVIGLLDAVDEF